MSRRDGRVSEQKAETAARNRRSALPASPLIVICLKSEDDTEIRLTQHTRTRSEARADRACIAMLKLKLAAIR